MNVLDFETDSIEPYPDFPPKPAGVSIWMEGAEAPHYYAWGHPSGNNCTLSEATAAVRLAIKGEVVMHNARFDMAVAEKWMDIKWPKDPLKIHDTLYLNFLYDVNAPSLSLKPSAERILGIPPDEQTSLQAYLRSQGLREFDYAKVSGELVAPYANGDTFRTRKLFDHTLDYINRKGMLSAYRREQTLAPILNANERDGIRVNLPALQRDLEVYEKVFKDVSDLLSTYIGSANPDSPAELAHALISKGFAKESDFLRTEKTKKISTAKASMDRAIGASSLRTILAYRGALKTILSTFMRTWERIASQCGGWLHPQFHQVKTDDFGARTGRLSSSDPSFQNVPTEFEIAPPEGFPPLPLMRQYVLPDSDDEIILTSDFNGQEMRVMAHFAEGKAAEIYRENPRADFHKVASDLIHEATGNELGRKKVKIIGFTMIYGGGAPVIAERLGIDKDAATEMKRHYFEAIPGFKQLMEEVSSRGRKGQPVKTWGDRLIYAEPPKMVQGRYRDYSYKLVNHLVQGSSADQTKEAINTAGYRTECKRFMATVHDENVYSVKKGRVDAAVMEVKASMEDQLGWDVPFRVEMKTGDDWHYLSPLPAIPG